MKYRFWWKVAVGWGLWMVGLAAWCAVSMHVAAQDGNTAQTVYYGVLTLMNTGWSMFTFRSAWVHA